MQQNSLFLCDPLEIMYSLSQAQPADRLRKEVALGFTSLFVGPPLTMFVYGKYLGWTFQVPPLLCPMVSEPSMATVNCPVLFWLSKSSQEYFERRFLM